jgi:DNA-binding CsgD family transcriptional regulator
MKKEPKLNYWQIPSIKHRHLIKKLVKHLYTIDNFGGFSFGLVLKNGQNAWLSSTPRVTLHTVSTGLDRAEILLDFNYLKQSRVIFPDELTSFNLVEAQINNILEKKGIYRGYCYSKYCDDCCVIVGISSKQPVRNPPQLYRSSKDLVEKFSYDFLNQTQDIFLQNLPELTVSRFMQDKTYQKNTLIGNNTPATQVHLSNKDLAILYWTARGKSAEEIAIILGLSKNTIDTYRRAIIQKLDVANITEAVHFALSSHLII